jgi:hypothetical protein
VRHNSVAAVKYFAVHPVALAPPPLINGRAPKNRPPPRTRSGERPAITPDLQAQKLHRHSAATINLARQQDLRCQTCPAAPPCPHHIADACRCPATVLTTTPVWHRRRL